MVFRKLANHSKPNTEILLVDDDAVKIGMVKALFYSSFPRIKYGIREVSQ